MPLFAVIFGDILGVLSYCDVQKARDEVLTTSLLYCKILH